jgi:hypothetical protein
LNPWLHDFLRDDGITPMKDYLFCKPMFHEIGAVAPSSLD